MHIFLADFERRSDAFWGPPELTESEFEQLEKELVEAEMAQAHEDIFFPGRFRHSDSASEQGASDKSSVDEGMCVADANVAAFPSASDFDAAIGAARPEAEETFVRSDGTPVSKPQNGLLG